MLEGAEGRDASLWLGQGFTDTLPQVKEAFPSTPGLLRVVSMTSC